MIKSGRIIQLMWPVITVLGAFIIGIIVEKILSTSIRRLALRTKWLWDEILIDSVHNIVAMWFVILGIYCALFMLPLTASYVVYYRKLLLVVAIFSVTVVLARIAGAFVNLYANKIKGVLPSTSLFSNITQIFVYLIGVLIILQTLDVKITPVLTALGIGGLAVALALQDTLSNLFAGIHLAISKQIMPSNYIKLDSGDEGYITDITWRTTTIKSLAGNIIIIPNSKIASAVITNYSLPNQEVSFTVQVGTRYDNDLEKIELITLEVANEVMKNVEGGVPGYEPSMSYHTFGESSIYYNVYLHAQEFADQYSVRNEFIKRLHLRFRKEGLAPPFPTRIVSLHEGVRS